MDVRHIRGSSTSHTGHIRNPDTNKSGRDHPSDRDPSSGPYGHPNHGPNARARARGPNDRSNGPHCHDRRGHDDRRGDDRRGHDGPHCHDRRDHDDRRGDDAVVMMIPLP